MAKKVWGGMKSAKPNRHELRLTAHGSKRLQQRGLRERDLQLILNYGHREHAPGRAIKYWLPGDTVDRLRQDLIEEGKKIQRRIKSLQHLEKGGVLVLDETERVVMTAYKRTDRRSGGKRCNRPVSRSETSSWDSEEWEDS